MDDELNPMPLSPDPMLEEMRAALMGITPGRPGTYGGELKSILRNPVLFAVDLYQAGLGEKIEGMFLSLIAKRAPCAGHCESTWANRRYMQDFDKIP